MTTWVVIALGCALLGGALAAAVSIWRRKPVSPSAPAVSIAKKATIPNAGSDVRGTGFGGTGMDEGGVSLARQPTAGIPFESLIRRSAKGDGQRTDESGVSLARQPTTGIPFESLFRRSAQNDRQRMDPRELVAAQQQGRILPSSGQLSRQTGRASVQRSLDGGDVLIFDRAVVRRSAEDAFAGLVTRGSDVRVGLGGAVGQVDLAWPQEAALRYDGGVTGYFMPGLDASYVFDVPRHGQAVRTLGAANGLIDAEVLRLGDADLLELGCVVAVWLRAMHAAGVVFGDLGPRSLAYATTPMRIRVLDYDTARVVGRGALLAPDPEAEHDPLAPAGESSYDSDRFLFAQLAFRLLVTRNHNGVIASEVVPARLLGLDERRTSRLRHLWQRAAGPRGTRPTMDEWVDALGER